MSKSVWTFFLLVFILSIPLWLLGAITGQLDLPINLPLGALQAINPLIAASILIYREKGSEGLKALLKRAVDFRKIRRKGWYLPILFFWPIMMVLAYGLMRLVGAPLPDDLQFPLLALPVFLVLFLVAATGEEVGWSGYATDRLQARRSALKASVIIGTVWAIWHIVPFMQAHRSPNWILWQCLGMIPFRMLIVWLYNNSGKSVFAATVFHAMSNPSQFLFPNYGSHYDPFFAWVMLALAAGLVLFLWGPETLARYRYAGPPNIQQ